MSKQEQAPAKEVLLPPWVSVKVEDRLLYVNTTTTVATFDRPPQNTLDEYDCPGWVEEKTMPAFPSREERRVFINHSTASTSWAQPSNAARLPAALIERNMAAKPVLIDRAAVDATRQRATARVKKSSKKGASASSYDAFNRGGDVDAGSAALIGLVAVGVLVGGVSLLEGALG